MTVLFSLVDETSYPILIKSIFNRYIYSQRNDILSSIAIAAVLKFSKMITLLSIILNNFYPSILSVIPDKKSANDYK